MDLLLNLDIDGAGGVVEDQHRRVHEQRAGDCDALTLSAGERVSALTDDRVVAIAEAAR